MILLCYILQPSFFFGMKFAADSITSF